MIHGNSQSRQTLYNLARSAKIATTHRPVVCNEDSPALGNMGAALRIHSSWGYYNNLTKQEPPCDWGITKGEDEFFAYRMAEAIGIHTPYLAEEDQFYLQGCEPYAEFEGKRWLRLASLYPESIDYVEFYRNDQLIYISHNEPFPLYFRSNWNLQEWITQLDDYEWKAVIYLRSGKVLERTASYHYR